MIAEQLNKQLVEQDLILESVDTLDINFSRQVDPYIPEPMDDEKEFSKGDDLDYSIFDDDNNDPDYVPEPEFKKPRISTDDIPQERMERAYRYWTRQDDYEIPLVISAEVTNMKGKRTLFFCAVETSWYHSPFG
ncbi:radical sam protein [Lasius niger]|uniref:Radical sam protein n=1 Tax=Lasius niger TaxID=67767 RepID=A0A0J7MYJ5_LASNI|nr:radical sam protein [Lasius niger]